MFLGVDIGTTAVKAIIVDGDQRVVAHAAQDHPTSRPRSGWSEQSPADWISAIEDVLGRLRSEARTAYAAIEALGLSGQMHSAVLLGGDLKPIRPAILWNDSRGQEQCAELTRLVPGLGLITGVQPMAGFSAAKLLWIREHQPEAFARVAHVILPKDYARLWLTSEIASDMSDAAGTQLFDEANRCWAPAAVEAVGLTPTQMPRLLEGIEIAGRLRPGIAARLGLLPGLPVAAGGGDAGTGAVGLGCIDRGQGFISLGTAAVFVVAQDRYAPKPETMLHNFAHSVPGRWYQMAGMLNGASCARWALDLLGETDMDAMMRLVEERYSGPSRLLFLPYLTGERTPHNNPDARGVFFGLDAATSKADIMQAVLEGVAFSLRDARNCLIEAASDCPTPGFIGGGSRSRLWGRIIANVTGLSLTSYRSAELGPALGAARLAIIAGTGGSVAEIARRPAASATFEPDGAIYDAYSERYEKFRALYASVEEFF